METATACPTSTATILACQKIAKTFKENIYELSSIRKGWDPEYARSLYAWINETIANFYSENLDIIHHQTYLDWHEVMVAGLQSLKVLRAQLKVDFRNDKEFLSDMFKRLGYSDFFSEAKNGDHLSLYNLLKTFEANMDEETQRMIVDKGVPETLFNKIFESAKQIENFKGCFVTLETENELNKRGMKEINGIYKEIQDICRIAVAYYQFDPVRRDEFNFYKVMVNL